MSKQKIELTHIELQFREQNRDVCVCYAVSSRTIRGAEIALAKTLKQTGSEMSARELRDWLSEHGARLDRADGPAYVEAWADGVRVEAWYRNGKLSRDDGPVRIMRWRDGSTIESYYRNGKPSRQRGPSRIIRYKDGLTVELFYRNGKLIKEERLAPLSRIAGIKVGPITPRQS
jgi:NAD-dependent DNA ligase